RARPRRDRAARPPGEEPGAPDGVLASAAAAPRPARARPLLARDSAGLSLPGRPDRAGPVVRARSIGAPAVGAARVQARRPARRAAGGTGARHLRADEGGRRRALRRAG